ncbi:MAG: hypothetical protein ACRDVG_12305, partial [Jatrophihabitantaceae bacterium]
MQPIPARIPLRRAALAVIAVAGTALGVAAALPDAAAATTPRTVFGGYAYATAARVGTFVASGATAVTQMC